MHFDLADLSLFRHVVEAGSITHGAERAHLALAAASTRIRNMEQALGAALLVRSRQGVTPTQAGGAWRGGGRVRWGGQWGGWVAVAGRVGGMAGSGTGRGPPPGGLARPWRLPPWRWPAPGRSATSPSASATSASSHPMRASSWSI